jgi:polysaccharide export outer membrane protein
MQKLKNVSLLLLLSLLLVGCVSNEKFVYLQDKGNIKTDSNGVMPVKPYSYKLQKDDVLYISLSTDDERLNKIFVPSVGGQMMQQSQNVSGTMLYYVGFTIDSHGDIELPYIGKIRVTNQEVDEAKHLIESQLQKFFKVFFLQVKIAEFKFSVLGYVNRPGQFFFQQNKVTILEGIAQAGDLENLAKRYEIHLYRQSPEGVKLFVIDLTNRSIVNSDLWYIQPNDILYVQPMKVRKLGDMTSFQTSMNVITPLLSSLLLVLNTYILVKNLN